MSKVSRLLRDTVSAVLKLIQRHHRAAVILPAAILAASCDRPLGTTPAEAPQAGASAQPAPAVAPAPPPAPPSLFGFTLGEPMTVPAKPCPKRTKQSMPDDPPYCLASSADAVHLFTSRPHFGGQWLIFRGDQLPDWVLDDTLEVEIVDGRVERILALTTATAPSADIERALHAKFGRPTSAVPGKLQNGLGLTFETVELEWVAKAGHITYQSILPGSSRAGAVTAATWASDKRLNDAAQRSQPQRPL